MKTAIGLFDKHKIEVTLQYDSAQLEVLEYPDFEQALTEHDKEIISLIDKMIKVFDSKSKAYFLAHQPDYGKLYAHFVVRLTELKNKIGV